MPGFWSQACSRALRPAGRLVGMLLMGASVVVTLPLLAQDQAGSKPGEKAAPLAQKAATEPTCEALKLEMLTSALRDTLDVLPRKPDEALRILSEAEKKLECLVETPKAEELSRLFRMKGIALVMKKERNGAREAFYQAIAFTPLMDCAEGLDGYGPSSVQKLAIPICQDASLEAQDSEVRVRMVGLKGVVKLVVDGSEKPIEGDLASMRLVAGRHFVQVLSSDKMRSQLVPVSIPEGETRIQEVDLKKRGLAVVVEKIVEMGTLRIEGLEPGSEVMLDGRTRLDLPLLRNIETGERHLMIKTPDGSVMGATVAIVADQETVYRMSGSPAPSSGFSLRKAMTFGALGTGALSALGSGAALALAAGNFGAASLAHETYAAASGTEPDYETLWGEVASNLERGRLMRTTGLILGGVALVTGGAGTFLLVTEGGGVTHFTPLIAPLPGASHARLGFGLNVQGRF